MVKRPEILPPEGKYDHEYNNKTLTSLQWLNAVRNDTTLPMQVRIDAAKAAAVYEHPRLAQINQDMTAGITIRIEGGLPALPGTDIIMPLGVPPTPPVAPKDATPANPEAPPVDPEVPPTESTT